MAMLATGGGNDVISEPSDERVPQKSHIHDALLTLVSYCCLRVLDGCRLSVDCGIILLIWDYRYSVNPCCVRYGIPAIDEIPRDVNKRPFFCMS